MSKLRTVPVTLKASNEFVARLHRHHRPVVGHKFSVACADDSGAIRGVAIVGRPTARMSDNGTTVEVTRVCTDGCANACSFLYRAAWRVSAALGYLRLITYTLGTESGSSLRGAGMKCLGARGGGSWSRESRLREDNHPLEEKTLWEISQ